MAICYMNNDSSENYNCKYNFCDDYIEVIIDYDISDECSKSGIVYISSTTKFKNQDILIIDEVGKKTIILTEKFKSIVGDYYV